MRSRNSWLAGILFGIITSLGVTGLFYLGKVLLNLPFVPFDIFDWMARHLPGAILNFTIDSMVRFIGALQLGPTASTAKLIEQTIAVTQFIVAGAVYGLIMGLVSNRPADQIKRWGYGLAAVGGLIALAVEFTLGFPEAGVVLTVAWLVLVFAGWGWLMGRWAILQSRPIDSVDQVYETDRRHFLTWAWGGSLALGIAALGLSRLQSTPQLPVTGSTSTNNIPTPSTNNTTGPAASPPADVLKKRFLPAPGTRPELTPTDQFYRIDINADVPEANVQTWRLALDGLVNKPLSLTLDDLQKYPSVSQAVTLSCISNEIGGDLISTGIFTGVPFKTVLMDAGLKPQAANFNVTAFDGFYESLGLQEAMDDRTLLVYQLNGAPLTAAHGFPLRIFIPNHYGMKQPKWIDHIEVVDRPGPGYWVDRGWSQTATPQTTSVIDTVAVGNLDPQKQTVPVGGIAWAGARGISKVEIQVDNGPWTPVQLRVPPLSPLTWVQWRYEFPNQQGRHVFHVRAYDASGAVQTPDAAPTFPNGATGINSYSVDL